jgi:D-proline reductase (dithiol) PrdB
MPRLDRLPQINRNNLLTFPAQVNDGAPFVAPTKPLAECRLAIVTTAGLHRRGGRLFGPGDQTYRVIPSATPTVDIVQSHTSLGFDRTAIMRDLNISFPIDRVRELVARGELGGLAPHFYSFMGAQRDAWPPRGCRARPTAQLPPAGARSENRARLFDAGQRAGLDRQALPRCPARPHPMGSKCRGHGGRRPQEGVEQPAIPRPPCAQR